MQYGSMFQNLVQKRSISTIKQGSFWRIVHIQSFEQKAKYHGHHDKDIHDVNSQGSQMLMDFGNVETKTADGRSLK